jgi:hypothetical protein
MSAGDVNNTRFQISFVAWHEVHAIVKRKPTECLPYCFPDLSSSLRNEHLKIEKTKLTEQCLHRAPRELSAVFGLI